MSLGRPPLHLPPLTPSAVLRNPPSVDIYHPAPGPERPPFFTSPAYDRTPDGKWGVYYDVVFEACAIKANNKPGYISTTRDAQGRVSAATRIIEPGQYYYVVPDMMDAAYPVVPSFDAWTFPSPIPARWVDAFNANIPVPDAGTLTAFGTTAMANQVKGRDGACLLTRYTTGQSFVRLVGSPLVHFCIDQELKNSHLVPQMYSNWYEQNKMWMHTRHRTAAYSIAGGKIINASGNGITLRADIHNQFDRGSFTFLVKDGKLLCHFLTECTLLANIYHNTRITPPDDVPAEIMYAHFAWAVIKQAGPSALKDLPLVSPKAGAARDKAAVVPSPKERTSVSEEPGAGTSQIPEHLGMRLLALIAVHECSQVILVEDDVAREEDGESAVEADFPLGSRPLSPEEEAAAFHEKFPHLRASPVHVAQPAWLTATLRRGGPLLNGP